ncbi:exodeoxyribonuclease VII large subunit [Prevotella melaninogenica]|uniref:exodeoxyribonuclease VII large subunit n=1 Tax=Prevotella TaxID=838 RepID=UPI0003AD4ECB|nr:MULTISPECIES: exodeoxyribonuclease VII large subunit [Prevotella]ERJ75102.1 exodeoxyribonuclease VII, large subunit [Prevotella sp. F0091]QUB73588.1 exodeoxyribonuclease VII large subunit [Prevotella melaninogenica]
MIKALSLFELNSLVADVIDSTMSRSYWVQAELSEARENRGHCYMELIEKNEGSNIPIARASAKCWSNVWMLIKPAFIRMTGQEVRTGMKVMLQVHAQFHPQYGFSWIVDDINPEYTMGDMMRKRQEIIRQLKAEGVFELQKELHFPIFAQRIAVISSETAAGYGDFCNQLETNEYELYFHVELFSAVMQGDHVEQSIINALNQINSREDDFDCVVIIRGGGATADLSGFDTLSLAENVANFPLPIVTGIGHERDESVLDMVSFQRVKTPTAAAAYLIDHLASTLMRVENAQTQIVDSVRRALEVEKMRVQHIGIHIPVLFSVVRTKQEARLDGLSQRFLMKLKETMKQTNFHLSTLQSRILPTLQNRLSIEQHRLEILEQRARLLDPSLPLKRGYSITLCNGKTVRNAKDLKIGDTIITRLEKGEVESRVERLS